MLKQFTFLLILSYSSLTQAAAWLPEPGHGTAIIGALAYSARAEFQSDGSKRAFGEDGRFTKKELYYYLAYSLTKDWGLIASGTMLNELSYENDFGEKKFSGAGDQYLAGRYFLTKNGTGAEVIQAGVTLPVYSDSADPTPGNGQNDFELRYLRDHFQIWGLMFWMQWLELDEC